MARTVILKRYKNRKLYDSEKKCYTTLAGVIEHVRAGSEVSVVEHETGRDITAVILAEAIHASQVQRPTLEISYLVEVIRTGVVPEGSARAVSGEG